MKAKQEVTMNFVLTRLMNILHYITNNNGAIYRPTVIISKHIVIYELKVLM